VKLVILASLTVSPKTPRDGRLLIPAEVAATLAGLGLDFPIVTSAGQDRGQVSSFLCNCNKEGAGSHEHHFVESPLLRQLVPGSIVQLELDANRLTIG
jgi:hypothetical protein